MTDEELIAQLKNSKGWPTLGKAAAARIEALTEQLEAARADAKEAEAYAEELEAKNGNLCDLAVNEHGRAERAEAKLSKAVKALLLARVHVANNEQGWSVGRASARSDLKIINATLAGIEGSNAP
jgi:hypothetical protein